MYSFVLTGGESNWRFGFCRNDPNTKNVMLILTYLPMDDTFRKFIKILADIKKSSYEEFRKFLSDAYYSKVPNRGGSLKLLYDNGINVSIIFLIAFLIFLLLRIQDLLQFQQTVQLDFFYTPKGA